MFLVSVMILFVACDPTDNNNNGNVTNYWTTNALVRLQLKGAVKTITQNETTTEFNSQGQVIKITNPQTGEVTYSYNAEGVLVNNGETVVLGGLYEDQSSNEVNKVPFFGDLPVVGNLFKNRTRESTKREMLIFITPKVISERTASK